MSRLTILVFIFSNIIFSQNKQLNIVHRDSLFISFNNAQKFNTDIIKIIENEDKSLEKKIKLYFVPIGYDSINVRVNNQIKIDTVYNFSDSRQLPKFIGNFDINDVTRGIEIEFISENVILRLPKNINPNTESILLESHLNIPLVSSITTISVEENIHEEVLIYTNENHYNIYLLSIDFGEYLKYLFEHRIIKY